MAELESISRIVQRLGINGHHIPHGTDKDSIHSYGLMYDMELRPFREDRGLNFLEIGVQGGGSVLLWQEVFDPDSSLNFIDIKDQVDHYVWDNRSLNTDIQFGDAYGPDAPFPNQTYHVIVDDGPHTLESQVLAVVRYAPRLLPGGILIIEDVQSPDWLPTLAKAVPDGPFITRTHDLRRVKGRYDDLVFVVERV